MYIYIIMNILYDFMYVGLTHYNYEPHKHTEISMLAMHNLSVCERCEDFGVIFGQNTSTIILHQPFTKHSPLP